MPDTALPFFIHASNHGGISGAPAAGAATSAAIVLEIFAKLAVGLL
jgi:hypothetical protein